MSDLPRGWVASTLGALCDPPQYGWTTSARKDGSAGLKFLRTTDISSGDLDWSSVPVCADEPPNPERYQLAPGDIVISRAGSVGLNYRLTDVLPAVFASYLIRFRPSNGIDGRYLAYYLKSRAYWSQIAAATSGITLANVNAKKLSAIKLPLAPRAEQERIVAAIEEQFTRLDAAVATVNRARQNLLRLRASVLQAAISGQLLGSSEAWDERPLDELIVDIHAGKSFKCDERPALPDEWGVVKVSAMTWGEFRESENKTVLPGRNIDERLEIRSGDVLLSRSNTVGYVGAVVKVQRCRPKLLLSDKSLRIVPSPELTPEWLVITLRSRPARRYIESVATGTSDSMRNISQPKIRALRIPVPPLDVQRRLAAEVDRQFAALAALARTLDVLTQRESSCRFSILATAFAGGLVPQDPHEHSASDLLEDIEAKRASFNGHKPTRVRQPRARRQKVLA